MQLLTGAAIVTTQEAWVKLHTPSASMGISAIKYLNKLYIVSPVTCSLPCNTSIRLIPQTYLKVAMWAANIINLSRLHFQSESFMPTLSLW